jgi:hypothetical protein
MQCAHGTHVLAYQSLKCVVHALTALKTGVAVP